jgi:putative endonuclease
MEPAKKPPHLRTGQLAEENARRMLESSGIEFVEKNYRSKFGEIDLIMREHETLIFVEVRYRKSSRFGSGAESITFNKRQRIMNTARQFLRERHLSNTKCRFDVISASGPANEHMKLDWIESAFD